MEPIINKIRLFSYKNRNYIIMLSTRLIFFTTCSGINFVTIKSNHQKSETPQKSIMSLIEKIFG